MKTKLTKFISRTASYSARLAFGAIIGLLACNGAYEGYGQLNISYGVQELDRAGVTKEQQMALTDFIDANEKLAGN